jgi:ABC transport system ATP-binding/permease protein
MTTEVLDALTKLFAMATMQDGGISDNERKFVHEYFVKVLDQDSVTRNLSAMDEVINEFEAKNKDKNSDNILSEEEADRTFQRFSPKVLSMSKKVSAVLTQDQKILVLLKIVELVGSDARTTRRRMEVLGIIADMFGLLHYYLLITNYVLQNTQKLTQKIQDLTETLSNLESQQFEGKEENKRLKDLATGNVLLSDINENVLFVSSSPPTITPKGQEGVPSRNNVRNDKSWAKHIWVEFLNGELVFLRVAVVDMYFVKYTGNENVKLAGFLMKPNRIYEFSRGSIIRTQRGNAFYYNDIVANFLGDAAKRQNLSFNAIDIEYKFKNGAVGLRGVSIAETSGKLIGIMGASGAGKTTMLNVLAGIETPSKGQVLLNGIDIHRERDKAQGVIGYVAQDDLLIEELTVYENLYYNTKLCFKKLSEKELDDRVVKVLNDLGLDHIKDLKVGSILNKTISGGQRKRLNIALELIREPAVLFLDEPTSGLSSKDSENVLDLLKELSSNKGKLIFVVIHQPSSEIFKMFDKLLILDTGGYQAYYNNPIDAVIYFQKETKQAKIDGECETCGNVNPEQIFEIIEDKVFTDKGQQTKIRKITPAQWNERFIQNGFKVNPVATETEAPPKALDLPSWFKQTVIFTTRDFLAKSANTQYVLINLLEAPLLAFMLAFIIRFQNDPVTRGYTFRYNDNIPAYILICVLVALFMGLTVSAEEIIKDRKIQRREAFLNLNRHSYLLSKIIILFCLSAIQTLSFVLIGNWLLDVKSVNLTYWLVLFTVSCFSNVLGLNISATFNSVVTIYITIPLLLIPQMILSGVIFNFNNLNRNVSDRGQVPVLADFMVSRWGFEAIAVDQYKNNAFQKPYFRYEKEESIADYRRQYWLDEMKNILVRVNNNYNLRTDSAKKVMQRDLLLLQSEIVRERYVDAKTKYSKDKRPKWVSFATVQKDLEVGKFDSKVSGQVEAYFDSVSVYYRDRYNAANKKRNDLVENKNAEKGYNLDKYKDMYFNESLSDLVKNSNVRDRILEYKGTLLQQVDPIFRDPYESSNLFDYRSQFLAPSKHFLGSYIDTYWFNIGVMWIMTLLLYFTLYFEAFRNLSVIGEKISKNLDKIQFHKVLFGKLINIFKKKPKIIENTETKVS